MLAQELLGSRVHSTVIERARHAPGAVEFECQIGAPVDDAIEIMALDGGEACVEIRRNLFRRKHRDRLRAQMEIDGVAHIADVPVLGEIDMRDLAERMHAGVGPPSAGNDGTRPERRLPPFMPA